MGRRGGAKGGGRGGGVGGGGGGGGERGLHEAQDHYAPPPGYNGLGGGPGRMMPPFGMPPPPQPQQPQHSMFRPEDMGGRSRIWPLTTLGVTEIPPPVPPLPPCVLMPSSASAEPAVAETLPDPGVFGGAPPPVLPPLPDCILNPGIAFPPVTAATAPAPASPPSGGEAGAADRKEEEYVIDHRTDRRTFFHTEGKSHAFGHTYTKPNGTQDVWQLGDRVRLSVEEVHFGNPRVGVMKGEPAPMPTMLKWTKDEFEKHVLDCAQVSFGSYWVWSAIGIRSNRILYAAKRLNVEEFNAVVVPPPHQAVQDEDIDLTYGASIQGIQLVPV